MCVSNNYSILSKYGIQFQIYPFFEQTMIQRQAEKRLKYLAKKFRAVVVVGPRQSGKTTLCKHVFSGKPYVSLENPDILEFATSDPRGFLGQFPKGAVLDEIQKAPHLSSYLQQILDETSKNGLFILIGSNNLLMQEAMTQSLAGRVAYLHLLPLSLRELESDNKLKAAYAWHIVHGGYPEPVVKRIKPRDWYANYISTYLERDVRQIKNISNLAAFTKFLRLCAGRVGQTLNMAAFSNDCGIDQKTVAAWLGVLQSSYVVYLLEPHFANFNKQITKSPKLYFYDTGVVCSLLGITDAKQIPTHSAKGALFENLILGELLKERMNTGLADNLAYWRDKTGHEVDIVLDAPEGITAIELKAGETLASDFFKGLEYFAALHETPPKKLLIYGGSEVQMRSDGVRVQSWRSVVSLSVA